MAPITSWVCLVGLMVGTDAADSGSLAPPAAVNRRPTWWSRLFRTDRSRARTDAPPAAPSLPEPRSEFPPVRLAPPLLGNYPASAPSDRLLMSRCQSLLRADPELQRAAIHVLAESGVLVLRGSLPSADLCARAERVARKTDGATAIRNELTVSRMPLPWFQQSPVALGAPPSSRVIPAVTGEPGPGFLAPPIPGTSLRPTWQTAPSASQETTARAKPAANSTAGNWQPVDRASISGLPAVTLGPPQVIPSRTGLPVVVTYLVPRPELSPPAAATTAIPAPSPASIRASASFVQTQVAKATIPRPESAPLIPPAAPAMGTSSTIQPGLAAANWVSSAGGSVGEASSYSRAIQPTAYTAGGRSDIDALLRQDVRASHLRYRLFRGELILSGNVRRSADLYELTAALSDLPGVNLVSFENLKVGG